MKSNWQIARDHASDMTTHGNYRGDCPVCGGRKTFTATIDTGTLKYNCYKLGCDVGGVFDTDMTASEIKAHMSPKPEYIRPEKETMVIPAQLVDPTAEHELFKRFVYRWGIFKETNLMYDVAQERVVFPIHYKGRMIDAVGRAVGQRKHPKWYRYTGAADYFTKGAGKQVVLVEDVISAIIVNQILPHVTGMAILGTSLTAHHMEKIQDFDQIVVALDPDAMGKTIEYRREIELWTGKKVTALKLIDDIKYRQYQDMEKLRDILS